MAMAQAGCPRLPQAAAAAVVAAAAGEPRWLAMASIRTCRPAWTTSESPERLVAACLQASTVIVEMRGCSVALRSLRARAYGTACMPDNDINQVLQAGLDDLIKRVAPCSGSLASCDSRRLLLVLHIVVKGHCGNEQNLAA